MFLASTLNSFNSHTSQICCIMHHFHLTNCAGLWEEQLWHLILEKNKARSDCSGLYRVCYTAWKTPLQSQPLIVHVPQTCYFSPPYQAAPVICLLHFPFSHLIRCNSDLHCFNLLVKNAVWHFIWLPPLNLQPADGFIQRLGPWSRRPASPTRLWHMKQIVEIPC